MQPIVIVPSTRAQRAGTKQNIASLFKRFGNRVFTLLLISLLVPIGIETSFAQTPASTPSPATAQQSEAKKAFRQLKTLEGSWQGTIMGISINAIIRAASSGTAILHEATTDGGRPPNHEITMFYVEADRLLATHFCDGGNRARLEGKMSPDGKTIEFSFLDVAGSTKGGLVKRMAFSMIDADHHIIDITFIMPDAKPMELRGEFQRIK